MHNFIKLTLLSTLFFLASCGGEEDAEIDLDNPEVVTIGFFNAIYNEKDIKKAAEVCSPKLARIIMHYKSPNAVARHVLNMSYDSVQIKADDSGVKVREQFKDAAAITVYFDGQYHGERLKDVKRVSLIQVDGNWVINKILKDPF